jgi:hypothetical protein
MSETSEQFRHAVDQSTPGSTDPHLEIWRHCRHYTVAQAALLIAGHNPANAVSVERLQPEERPPGYEGAKHAIEQALTRDSEMGRVVHLDPTQRYTSVTDRIDVQNSVVWASSLKAWSLTRGIPTRFFSSPPAPRSDVPSYLDPLHSKFSTKLAAAVRAWEAVSKAEVPTRVSPKRDLTNWLTMHASELGLMDKSGKPNTRGIEEVAKVANWQTSGGAPRTIGKS